MRSTWTLEELEPQPPPQGHLTLPSFTQVPLWPALLAPTSSFSLLPVPPLLTPSSSSPSYNGQGMRLFLHQARPCSSSPESRAACLVGGLAISGLSTTLCSEPYLLAFHSDWDHEDTWFTHKKSRDSRERPVPLCFHHGAPWSQVQEDDTYRRQPPAGKVSHWVHPVPG